MACCSPIRIKNRTTVLSKENTRYKLYVPCGHCEACRAQKQEDMLVRIAYEFNDFCKRGGKTIFLTYTFDDISHPRFPYYDHVRGVCDSFKCFDKSLKDAHVHAILDKFRRDLSLKFGISKSKLGKLDVKFVFGSEFGEEKGKTHRAHHHVLWHLGPQILELYSGYTEHDWISLFQDFWDYGYINKRKGSSIFVNSDFALRYVSKYMCKDLGFFKQPEVDRYLNCSDPDELKRRIDNAKDFFPKHWQSLHYGEGLVDVFDNLITYINGINFNFRSDTEKGRVVFYQIPKYVERKLLQVKDEHGRYVNTKKGCQFKFAKYFKVIGHTQQHMLELLDRDVFNVRTTNLDFRRCKRLSVFESLDDLYGFITSILGNPESVTEMILYNRVWSGKFTSDFNFYRYLQSCSHEEFCDLSMQAYYDSLCYPEHRFFEDGVFRDYDPEHDLGVFMFDKLRRFSNFDNNLRIIGEIEGNFRKFKHLVYLKDRCCRKSAKLGLLELEKTG